MKLFEIKSNFDNKIVFKFECESMLACVIAAIDSGANLGGANLGGADLSRAYLGGADLSRANLNGANLNGADLYGADLRVADLRGADLYGADLRGAGFYRADLTGADFDELFLEQQHICPSEGSFIGWKKLKGGKIARLIIPSDAYRMNAIGSRKCRASKVFVDKIFDALEGYDIHTGILLYKVGCEVVPDEFNNDVFIECSHGIHFFLTRKEAEEY